MNKSRNFKMAVICSIPIIVAHMINTYFIIRKKLYNKIMYLLLFNLTISDILMILFFNVNLYIGNFDELMVSVPFIFWYSSILTNIVYIN